MERLALYGGTPVIERINTQINKYGIEEENAVRNVIRKGEISVFRGGEYVKKFERLFAEYMSADNAITTTSGTTALHTSLAALDLPAGSEVAVPPLTFVSTVSVVLQQGLKPVFIDIDENYCLSVDDLKNKITDKMKAVIPVHIYGHPANMIEIMKVAKEHNLFVIEDACQAHGAKIGNKKVGTFGDLGCFSFFETKNMTCGEGGMITTNSRNLYQKVKLKKEHGSPVNSDTWYSYQELGYNYSMTELQAAIGIEQLKKLDLNNKVRKKNAELYKKVLENLPLSFQKEREDVTCVYHNLPVLLPKELSSKRDLFVKALKAEGVPVDIAYPQPLYKTELFRNLGYDLFLTNVEDVTSRLFTLFTDSSLSEELINKIGEAVDKVLRYIW